MMKEHNSVYLAWQDYNTRKWHVVGLLEMRDSDFLFNYTLGAKSSNYFTPFSGMEDLQKTYISKEIFPLFKNRLLSSKRPEYPNFIKWLGLDDSATPIDVLARSGGSRATDKLQMFKAIDTKNDGHFEHFFFSHGLAHLQESALVRVSKLKTNEKLYLSLDSQNEYDVDAVLIRAGKPAEIVGYCPRYISSAISGLLRHDSKCVSIYVESLPVEAPASYRLMCRLEGCLPNEYIGSLQTSEYEIVS